MLQLVVKLLAHVEHDVLSDAVEQDRLEVGEDEPQQLRGEVQNDEQAEAFELFWHDVPIDRVLRELRLENAEQVERKREQERRSQQPHVRLEIAQEPPRDLKVVSLADRFFFVKLCYRGCHFYLRQD